MHQRPALHARKHRRIDLPAQFLTVRKDHPAARAAQRLVRRRRHHIRKGQRRGMHPGRHQPGKMRHVHHQQRANLVGNRPEPRKIQQARIGRAARNDELRLHGNRLRLQRIIIDKLCHRVHAILVRRKPFARHRRFGAMRQMPARIQRHAQDRIARLHQRQHHRAIGLRARMRLHIHIGAVKQRLRPVNRQLLHHIAVFTALIIALARIAFRIFVRENRSLRLQHRARNDILRRDQLDLSLLACQFTINRRRHRRVGRSQAGGKKSVRNHGISGLAGHGRRSFRRVSKHGRHDGRLRTGWQERRPAHRAPSRCPAAARPAQ